MGLEGRYGYCFNTRVIYGNRRILILPNKEIEDVTFGVTCRTGPDEWDIINCRSEADAEKLQARRDALAGRLDRKPELRLALLAELQ